MKSKLVIIISGTLFFFSSTAFGYVVNLTPRISVGEEYTDNINLTNTAEEHDYITTVTPGFTAELPGKTSGASLSYDVTYVHYDRFDENDTFRHNASVSGWTNLWKKARLQVSDTFLRTEQPVSETDPTLRRNREPYYTNTAGIGLTQEFGASNSIGFQYAHSMLENEDPAVEDNQRNNLSASLTYWFTKHLSTDLSLSYNPGEFETSESFDDWSGSVRLTRKFTRQLDGFVQYVHTVRDYDGVTENYQDYDPSIGITYQLSEDTGITLSAGYFIQDNENSDDQTGFSGGVDLTGEWIKFKRGGITFSAASGFEASNFGAENLGSSRFYQAGARLRYDLARRLSSNLNGTFRRTDYLDQAQNREDNIIRAGAGLSYQILKWLFLNLNYAYNTLDSTGEDNDYTENSVTLQLTASPSTPFRWTY